MKPVMRRLLALGQSGWLDYLHRGLTRSGGLSQMVSNGLRGMTSNPTILEHAIAESDYYDEALRALAKSPMPDRAVLETLAIQDIQEAADILPPVYEEADGADGFISIEVSPELAHDTEATVAEARRLWRAVNRSNTMVKIPGTRAGWPAIERCLYEGININVTLLFSLNHYEAVAEAHLHALEARAADGRPIDRVASAASLFVSRVDTQVDKRIDTVGARLATLRGTAATANARLVYTSFLNIVSHPRWKALEAKGAKPQRPLWASVGTKNSNYSDIRMVDVSRVLESEGLDKFARSVETVLRVIRAKRAALARSDSVAELHTAAK